MTAQNKALSSLVVLAISASLILDHVAVAQTARGEVSGIVTDPTGAVVPGAKLMLRNIETAVETSMQTNAAGIYVFVNISPGTYQLSVEVLGFKSVQTVPFTVNVNQSLVQDFSLEVGAVTETVEVTGQAELIQGTSTELGTVITEQSVRDLPLNGRNFSQIMILTPGTTPVSTAQGEGSTDCSLCLPTVPGTVAIRPSVQGQWNRSNMYLLDGILNEQFLAGTWAVQPVIDSVQEFKVQSHNDKAEFGGVLGGTVNVVSKSGTNQLRGSVWEFLRNDALNARDPFADEFRSSPASFRFNQFGAAVGGPVYIPKAYDGRNKTWFFFTYEGWRLRQASQSFGVVPTAAELSGDFSSSIIARDIFDPLTTQPDASAPSGFVRTQFPNNIIPANRFDPLATQYLNDYFDRPNLTGDPEFNLVNPNPSKSDSDLYQIKADQQLGGKHTVFFRYSQFDVSDVNPQTLTSNRVTTRPRKNLGGGWTYVISPSVILESRLGWSSQPWNPETVTEASKDLARQAGWVFDENRFPSIDLDSPWSSGPGFGRAFEKDKQWHLSENLTWLQGKHNLKFGFQLIRQPRGDLPGGSLSYTFGDPQTADPNSPGNTGASLASFLLGIPAVQSTASQDYWFHSQAWSLYAQDEWKLSPRFTLNWGLRYDHFDAPRTDSVRGVKVAGRGGLWSGPDPNTGDWIIGATELPPACNAANVAPCIPGDGLQDVPFGNEIRLADRPDIWDAQSHNIGPRFGLAYRVTDRTVVRAGYGVVYDFFSGHSQQWEGIVSQWPDNLDSQRTVNDRPGAPIQFIQDVQRDILSSLPAPSPWDTLNWFSDPKKRNPISHQWNMEIQHQMADKLMVSVGYVGSTSYFLDHTALWNTAFEAGLGDASLRRPYPYASTNWMGTDEGRSTYHAFTSQVNRRFTNGFSLLGAYTWGKCMDNVSGWFGAENGPGGVSGLSNFYDTRPDKAVCSYDVPHFFTVSGLWEVPFGKGKSKLNKGPASWILGDWQVNYIFQARSGQPVNLEVPGDVANIGSGISWFNYSRPNLVGDPELSNPTPERWFNPDAFAVPGGASGQAPQFGNLGRNTLRTESAFNFDLSVFKDFPIGETARVQFRFEAFNLFNVMNYGAPNTLVDWGAGWFNPADFPDAARINSLATNSFSRQLQFALKIYFGP